jgi:hypothetical protein
MTVNDVRQIEIHTAEPLVPDPSPFEVEIAIAKLKRYKSPGSDQIPAELIQAGCEKLRSKIQKLITRNSMWNKEKLPDQWKESIIVPVHTKGDKTECNNYRGLSMLSTSYKILSNILLSWLSSYIYIKLLVSISVGFYVTDQLLIRPFAFVRYLRNNVSTMRQYISYS